MTNFCHLRLLCFFVFFMSFSFTKTIEAQTSKKEKIAQKLLKKAHVLIYTKNGEGFVHDNIASSVKGLKKLAMDNGFTVDVSDDPSIFTPGNIDQYDLLIFSNTNNEAFDNQTQRDVFKNYIQQGGGLLGIHSASGSERDWPWFWKVIGGKFLRHSKFQSFSIVKIDPNHISAQVVPNTWVREDESYYLKELNPDIQVILATDLTSIEDDKAKNEYPANTFGNYFPVTWCHNFDGGHQWYTSLGHRKDHYEDSVFMNHILSGIKWILLSQAGKL